MRFHMLILALAAGVCVPAAAQSMLAVESDPPGAAVWVSPPGAEVELLRGYAPTHVIITSAPAGGAIFSVRLESPGYEPYETKVLLHDRERIDVKGQLTRAAAGDSDLITIAAVGDICLGKVADPFRNVAEVLGASDIAFGNLEGAITVATATATAKPPDAVSAGDEYVFSAPPEHADFLTGAGIDIVSLANNHAMDFRARGLLDTINELSVRGIVGVGAGPDLASASALRIVRAGRKRVGFLAASCIAPWGFAATQQAPGVYAHPPSMGANDPLVEAVKSAAGTVDVLVVSIHWGIEKATKPEAYQRALADAFIKAGADLVIGHHPHCLQPIEVGAGKVIAYSLGNSVGLGTSALTRSSLILRVAYDSEGLVWVEVTPVTISPGLVPEISGDPKRIFRRGLS